MPAVGKRQRANPAKMVAWGTKQVLKYAANKVFNSTQNKKNNDSSVVTTQNDNRVMYRKKKPKKKNRQKIKKQRLNFQNNLFKNVAPWNWHKNFYVTSSSALGQQQLAAVIMNSYKGGSAASSVTMHNQLSEAINYYRNNLFTPSGLAANQAIGTFQTRIIRSVMDITLTNTGSTNMELDIYECYCSRDCDFADLALLVSDLQTKALTPAVGAFGGPTITTLGQSMFDVIGFTKYFKIAKVTRVYVTGQQAISMVRAVKKSRSIWTQPLDATDGTNGIFAKKGLTRAYIFIHRGVPDAVNASAASSLAINANYHVQFKTIERSQAYDVAS